MWWKDVISETVGKAWGIVDKIIPSKDLTIKTKADIQKALIELEQVLTVKFAEFQSKVYMQELRYGAWYQRMWRPMFMYLFLMVLFNNWFLCSYFPWAVEVELTQMEWVFINLISGLYAGSRGVEHIVGRKTKKKEEE